MIWQGSKSRVGAEHAADAVGINAYLPEMRSSIGRDDADRRLPVLLWLQGLRREAEASRRRLLCVLLLWFRSLSSDPGRKAMLLADRVRDDRIAAMWAW